MITFAQNFIMKKAFILILLIFPLLSQAQFSKDLKKLAAMMQGSYSSQDQSKIDSAFFDIRLKIIPIWTGRTDALWMYVEQAVAGKEDRPYRQRVYKITEPSVGNFESAVITLNAPLRFVGHADLVEKLIPDSLSLREGCSVLLKKTGKKSFSGGTDQKKCPSDMRNAAYATSIVTLTPKLLASWDRGYDKEDRQVWGAVKGAYQFRKIKK